jgi:hypothetical protein
VLLAGHDAEVLTCQNSGNAILEVNYGKIRNDRGFRSRLPAGLGECPAGLPVKSGHGKSVIRPHPKHVALGGIMARKGERMPFPRCQG